MPTIARTRRRPDSVDWSFDHAGGPVVAVAALCGGAGASSMTYLTAAAVARDSTAAVLVIDAGGCTGGLSFYAGVEGPYSLPDLVALDLDPAPHQITGNPFAQSEHGVRVLATGPGVATDPRDVAPQAHGEPFTARVADAVQRIVADAQTSHGMTLIDCGTLSSATERAALATATHIVWLLPATTSGVRRAKRLLDTLDPFRPGQEIVCARRDQSEKKAPMVDLTTLSEERVAPLLLMPHIPDLARHSVNDAIGAAEVALESFVTLARR